MMAGAYLYLVSAPGLINFRIRRIRIQRQR